MLADASVKLSSTALAHLLRWAASLPGRATHPVRGEPFELTSAIPENALDKVLVSFRPDVVVANSMVRWSWRVTRGKCAAASVPTVLYIREIDSLPHLDAADGIPDFVLANSHSLATAVEARGHPCPVLPSVIETGVTAVASSREVVLAINPIESRGWNMMWRLAERMPEIRFVVQETWALDGDELDAVNRQVARLPNLEYRRTQPAGPEIYRDARVLLVPHRIDNRPRVIAEAHANGIPVIATDAPALVETVGPGGLVVAADDVDAWEGALRRVWEDAAFYSQLQDRAIAHSLREEISPVHVASRFESFLNKLVEQKAAKGLTG